MLKLIIIKEAEMDTRKNNTLELLKLLAAYMVVFIHVTFYGKMGAAVGALARFAVPLFFLVSGFYSYQITPQKIIKRAKKILFLLIVSTVLYTTFNIAPMLLRGDFGQIATYFSQYLNFSTLIKLLLFNVPVSSVHLWYLYAMLYVYIVFYIATRLHLKDKPIFIVSFILLAIHLFLGEFLSAFDVRLPIFSLRNFALMGIPFFSLGMFVKKYEVKLRDFPDYLIPVMLIVGALASVVSRYLFGKNELYLGSLLVLLAVTVIFIKYSNVRYPKFINVLTDCNAYIYIFHIMVERVIEKVFELCGIDPASSFFIATALPIIVCIVSTLVAYLIQIFTNFLFKRKKQTLS